MSLKDKIIESAYQLFSTKGFEKTTITDIVKASDSSKGGFYHHFSSKEDIVSYIMNRYVEDIVVFYNKLYESHNNDLIQVFVGVFDAINDFKRNQFKEWPEMLKMLSFPGNDLIIMKMAQSFEEATIDFYEKLLIKGNNKVWTVDNPKHVAGLWGRELIRIYSEVTKTLYAWSDESLNNLEDLLSFNEQLIEAILKTDQIKIKDRVLLYIREAKSVLDEMNIQL